MINIINYNKEKKSGKWKTKNKVERSSNVLLISVNVSRLNIELYNRVKNTNNKLFTRDILKIKQQRKTEHKGMENVILGKCQTS